MNELKVILNELKAVASPKKKNFKVIIKILKLKKLIKIEIEYINITKKKKKGVQIHKVLKLPSQIFIF